MPGAVAEPYIAFLVLNISANGIALLWGTSESVTLVSPAPAPPVIVTFPAVAASVEVEVDVGLRTSVEVLVLDVSGLVAVDRAIIVLRRNAGVSAWPP